MKVRPFERTDMQLEVIGVGGAGCRIAGAIRDWDGAATAQSFCNETFAFDTDTESLAALAAIPEGHRHRYGEAIEHGYNGNLQRGLEVGSEHVDELSRRIDEGQPSVADGFLVAIGLGGATGGGTAPALVANLQQLYDAPVYVLATLPAARELEATEDDAVVEGYEQYDGAGDGDGPGDGTETSDGVATDATDTASEPATRPLAEANAVQTLERLDGLADAIVCFDNEAWLKTGETLLGARERLNRELATRVGTFFAATADTGETGAGLASAAGAGPDAETVIDANDVGRILGSTTAIVTIGYGEQQVDAETGGSLLGLGFGPDVGPQLFGSETDVDTGAAYSAVETVIGKALRGKLTLECDRKHTERAMVIVGGPPTWLNRQAMADGRRTVEQAIGSSDTLGGDAPRSDGDTVFAVVVLADVEPVERLETLRKRGRETGTE